ncbi:MAG: peptidoglycan-binding domain-containing protein [Anaerocolumna sp.]
MYIKYKKIYPTQVDRKYFGKLQVHVVCESGSRPVENAEVQVFHKYDPNMVVVDLITDISGKTVEIDLPAPPIEYSMNPTSNQPYAEYRLIITAPGLRTVEIDSVQLLPFVKTVQPVRMPRKDYDNNAAKIITIGTNFLYGNYPPKVYEDEVKDNIASDKPVIIPEFIIVHDGIPTDSTAENYKIEYREYIKSVVTSQIYATWPQETIYANLLARLSFSLNRVYTDWYPNQGYDFTITSSTSYDQIWFYGRNIDSNINLAVDHLFNYFLSLPDISQPILTQACAENLPSCTDMISLWGSKYLGDQAYQAIDILHYYYGDMLYINSTDNIEGITAWPNMELKKGTKSEDVNYIQNQLKTLAHVYNEIPLIVVDGFYGPQTEKAVSAFQKIFDLPVAGTVDAVTWHKIGQMYKRITRAFDLCK